MKKQFQSKPLRILFVVIIIIGIIVGIILRFPTQPSTPNFSDFEAGKERKMAFFSYFSPLIDENNQSIENTRKQLLSWHENKENIGWWDELKLADLVITYRVKNFAIDDQKSWQKLLKKVDVLPPSLVLAQAANESAWGTSRFAKVANNYFGQWCYKTGCGFVPKQRSAGEVHEVAAFETPIASLESYMNNLNSHPAYQQLRDIRAQRRKNNQPITGTVLAAGLIKYSQRGEEYIEEIRAMIKFNALNKYDQNINNN